MEIDLNRFRDTFFEETDEHLAHMESGLLELEAGGTDAELMNAIFRGAHSIKGASGTFGFDRIEQFTHALETLLDAMRAGRTQPNADRITLLLRALDVLRTLVTEVRENTGPTIDFADLCNTLVVAQRANWTLADPAVVRKADVPSPSPGTAVYRIHFAPSQEIFRQGMDPILVLRELHKMGQVLELNLNRGHLPHLADLDPESCYMAWDLRLETARSRDEVQDVFAFVEDGAEISIAEEKVQTQADQAAPAPADVMKTGAPREASSIRVATEKVDKLIDLVGELVIAQSMAAQVLGAFTESDLPKLQEAFASIERYTRELQERVMSVRMLPVGTVFSRFPRLVRDLASATGKDIRLQMSGEETELDKGVVESISDPLMHLVRNAADHGIEPPEERRALGKPEHGTIQLRALHQNGNVIIEVTDDGRGLNPERIRQKAIENGLIQESDQLTEEETFDLVFAAGISTAKTVSNISGRGVGMDVVKRNVESLSGSVSLGSTLGKGTSVHVKLPLTLAIMDGLLVKVGEQTFVLPLISILESIRPHASQLNPMAGQGEVVIVRGEPLPLLRLHRMFGIANVVTDPTQGLVAIVEHQGRRFALLVDELLGQQQVVIKGLETHFRKVEGITGATILGDGQPALILDVAGLAMMSRNGTRAAA